MKNQKTSEKRDNEKPRMNQSNIDYSITELINSEQDETNRQQMRHNNE